MGKGWFEGKKKECGKVCGWLKVFSLGRPAAGLDGSYKVLRLGGAWLALEGSDTIHVW